MRFTARRAAESEEPERDSQRFIVRQTEHGYSVEIVGRNPDTRYVPSDQRSRWRRFVDRFKLGLRISSESGR